MNPEQLRTKFMSRTYALLHPENFRNGVTFTTSQDRANVKGLLLSALASIDEVECAEASKKPQVLGTAEEYLESLRVGWRLVIPDPKKVLKQYRDTTGYVEHVRGEIDKYGDQALGHVVFSYLALNLLSRNQIYLQDQLDGYLARPYRIRGLGSANLLQIHERYQRFKQLQAQFPDELDK